MSKDQPICPCGYNAQRWCDAAEKADRLERILRRVIVRLYSEELAVWLMEEETEDDAPA